MAVVRLCGVKCSALRTHGVTKAFQMSCCSLNGTVSSKSFNTHHVTGTARTQRLGYYITRLEHNDTSEVHCCALFEVRKPCYPTYNRNIP